MGILQSLCISIMTKAVVSGESEALIGHGYGVELGIVLEEAMDLGELSLQISLCTETIQQSERNFPSAISFLGAIRPDNICA